jgi:dCMP deaminase
MFAEPRQERERGAGGHATDADKAKALKYIRLAQTNADLFSKDPRTKVGAIVLADDFSCIKSCGINGLPRKMDDACEARWRRPTKYDYVCHAEANAVANAARTGAALDGSVIAVTKFPCSMCARLLIQAGIRRVYTPTPDYGSETWGEDARVSEEMFGEVGIEVVRFDFVSDV